MIAVINKDKSAVQDIALKIDPLISRKLNQFVAGEITKGTFENFFTGQGNDIFHWIYRQRCVFNQGMKQVGRHALVCIPVSGFILKSRKKELLLHCDLKKTGYPVSEITS